MRTKESRLKVTWLGGAGALGFVAVVMLMAPMAGASAPVFFRAPFLTGHAIQTNTFVAQGPNAQAAVLQPAGFSLFTGNIHNDIQLGVAGSLIVPQFATYTGLMGVSGLTFTTSTQGLHVVTVTWSLTYRADLAITGKVLPTPPALLAQLNVKATASLVDKSTGAVVPGSLVKVNVLDKTLTQGTYTSTAARMNVVLFSFPLDLAAGSYAIATTISVNAAVLELAPAMGDSASLSFYLAPSSVLSLVQVV